MSTIPLPHTAVMLGLLAALTLPHPAHAAPGMEGMDDMPGMDMSEGMDMPAHPAPPAGHTVAHPAHTGAEHLPHPHRAT
ncbi:hypothetical protein, partial [Acetobacter okinawensis]|uniref:hypothetical protein n=1 Tax=Acetobacter okinawensis TaxID=1076594 RepID=UPI0018FFA216